MNNFCNLPQAVDNHGVVQKLSTGFAECGYAWLRYAAFFDLEVA